MWEGVAMRWSLEVVPVNVADVDSAKRFYSEQVGFQLDLDQRISEEMRIVQLTPPGSTCSIQLRSGRSRLAGLQLVVDDVDEVQRELARRGVEVTEVLHFEDGVQKPGRGGDWNSFVFFADPDGNSWVVQERPAEH